MRNIFIIKEEKRDDSYKRLKVEEFEKLGNEGFDKD